MENNLSENEYKPEQDVQQAEQPVAENSANGKNGFVQKVKDFVRKLELGKKLKTLVSPLKALPKKVWIIAGSALLALVVLITTISLLSNTYKTPVKIMENLANSKRFVSTYDKSAKMLNGFCKNEVDAILKLAKKVDGYEDAMEDAKDSFEDGIQELKDEYGNNYKISYIIDDKEKLEKDDLKKVRDALRELADNYEELADEADDFDSDDWEDFADEVELSKANAKKLVAAVEDLGKICKTAKVSAGYELTLTKRITGSELDEPEEDETTMRVYKIDGRWVSESALLYLSLMGSIG